MSLAGAHQYLFYRTYLWQLNTFGQKNNPRLVALLSNSLFVYFNLLTVVVCFQLATGYRLKIEKTFAIVGLLLITSINYFILSYDNKLSTIISKFADEDEIQKRRGTIWCWVYVIGTHVLFFGAALLL